MACRNCAYFKKIRNYGFGECANDEMFQYAENKEDLKALGNNTLVILGKGEPVVGLNFDCPNYSPKSSNNPVLTTTGDFANKNNNYAPPALQKRQHERPKFGGFDPFRP